MKPSASQSKKRNRDLIAKFAAEIIAKNDDGILRHGGGLAEKDTTNEIGDEIKDLVNYWVEHREQVGKLVAAVEVILPMAKGFAYEHNVGNNKRFVEQLRAALAPFLKKVKTKK